MVSARPGLWTRWIWRDLRRNWVAILVVACVIAIGTGVYAGLSSSGEWRRASNDASFAAQEMHDLRVSLAPGTFAEDGALARLALTIPSAAAVSSSQERLILPTQVDATTPDERILVPGRIVGLDPQRGPDLLWVAEGEAPDGDGVVLETKFANTYDLPAAGSVRLAGGERVDYVGLGSLPTDFYVSGERGDVLAQFNFAVLYTTLERARELGGHPGAVNDLVVTLNDGTDRDRVQSELQDLVGAAGFSATVTDTDDDESFRILYEDIDNDQRLWSVLSAIVLGSAALAAFNLVSRLVDAQRREIGVGMAIGVSTRMLVLRPLLIGVEIAILGVVLGVVVGLGVGAAMRNLLVDLAPRPVWPTEFQPAVYAQAAALGVAVPLISAALPIWRAVRVQPIDAIRTTHLAGKRPPRVLRRIRVPGSSLNQMPLRNLLRTPRRTLLTTLGVASAITALVAVLGMLDSFGRTIELADAEVTRGAEGRVTATLDGFQAADGDVIEALAGLPGIAQVDHGVQLPVEVSPGRDAGEQPLALLVESIDVASASWTPTGSESVRFGADGLLVAVEAADDLGISVGDVVTVRHPVRAAGVFGLDLSEMRVVGLHPNPLRVFAYVGPEAMAAWGFGGLANVVQVTPDGATPDVELQSLLFETSGVVSAQPATRTREVFEDAIEQFTGFLFITQVAVVALASLIAFNSARITVEERRREHATMSAFGAPVRSILTTIVKEGVLIGVMATGIGLAAGFATLRWMIDQLVSDTLPELGVVVDIRPSTIAVAAAIGVGAAAATPVLMLRRLRSMNLPNTLRLVE